MTSLDGRRVAFLLPAFPLPVTSGDRHRNRALLRAALRAGAHVSVFAVTNSEQEIRAARHLGPRFKTARVGRTWSRVRASALAATGRPLHRAYFSSPSAIRSCRAFLDEADPEIIVLSQLYMAPYLPTDLEVPVVFDTQNAEVERLATMCSNGSGLRARIARSQIGSVAAYEAEVVSRAAVTVAVSSGEAEYFTHIGAPHVELAANGYDVFRTRPRKTQPAAREILFMGKGDYSANRDALRFLLADVAPLIRSDDVQLTILGSREEQAPGWNRSSTGPATRFEGVVPSVVPFLRRASLLVVPTREGAGTRVKIIEALAHGVPVVTTALGVRGLELEPEHDVLVADRPDRIAAAIDSLLTDDEFASGVARNGRRAIERYDWAAVLRPFVAAMARLGRSTADELSH